MKEEQKLELYQDSIDKLLHKKELSENEQAVVKNDIDFKNYQAEFSTMSEGIKRAALHKKLDEIKALENKFGSASANSKQSSSKRKWLLALGLLFLLGLAYLFLQLNKGGSYDKDLLLASNVPSYPVTDATRGSDNSNENQAYVHYKKGEHSLGVKEFEKLIAHDNNPKHRFYAAISLIETKKYKEAQNMLQHASLKDYKELPINFYLALAKIGTDDPKEAIELLSKPTLPSPILDDKRLKLIRILSR